jgi:hypothetical protein
MSQKLIYGNILEILNKSDYAIELIMRKWTLFKILKKIKTKILNIA